MSKTVFEQSQPGQHAYSLPKDSDDFHSFLPPKDLTRESPFPLPELSEIDLTRHFSNMARRSAGIDNQFFPLGSCTMKFNPRVNEWCAGLPGFVRTHPLAADEMVQGNLHVIAELLRFLCQISGMAGGSLLPNAGAQGEFVGVKMISAYHLARGDTLRTEFLIPDNAHGTNPASAAMAGYKTLSIRTNARGSLDTEHLKTLVSSKTAGLMLTNPNTLGLFTPDIAEIAAIVHQHGGLLYYDGANLNAIANIVKPGDMGFDVMHINLHKTFSTPHGGGGPGSGPVLCVRTLTPFLPVPQVIEVNGRYHIQWENQKSIGKIASFHGNFGVYLRAYLYVKLHGHAGIRRNAEMAVLNANYLKKLLSRFFTVPYHQYCMHEFVLQADNYLDRDIKAVDIAKRLLDFDVYAPTMYFPSIVKECLLVEPTESESKATLDYFAAIVEKIVNEIKTDPEKVKSAPHTKPVSRLDEVRAARFPVLRGCL